MTAPTSTSPQTAAQANSQHPAHLFAPLTLRGLTLRNRVFISPMCQYSCQDGYATDWHLVHLGSRAVGGAALVMAEASAVSASGRISPHDLGIYLDGHVESLARAARFIAEQGAVPAIQLAHAGRKASTHRPWDGGGSQSPEDGGWPVVGPSAIPFAPGFQTPHALSEAEIASVVADFAAAARRALDAGFQVVELHGAHGYLLHQFLSPLSNTREDGYGGDFQGRTRLTREVVQAVRAVWPDHLPLFVRLSCTDWVEGGWALEDSIALTRVLAPLGVDLIDCSSGGNVPKAPIPIGPGYQVPFAEAIRWETGIPTAAVGLITEPAQAEAVIANGQADLIALARAELRDPYWALHAATALDQQVAWPRQYERSRP